MTYVRETNHHKQGSYFLNHYYSVVLFRRECRVHTSEAMASDTCHYSKHVSFFSETPNDGSEKDALETIDPAGFVIRHPPKPHELDAEVTDESQLFQTIHMGAAVVDRTRWRLVVDGLVERPFSVSYAQLTSMPCTTITSFHECYGSPVAAPIHALWRIGNVKWTGVRVAALLRVARPKPEVAYVWSQGLESGSFAGVVADRYEKDLPVEKALSSEVLIAYEMNGEPLSKNRGGPVRLIVSGWFGTNATKWVCRLSLQDRRSAGPFTTTFYNEIDPTDPAGQRRRPVWMAEPNSMIVRPKPGEVLQGPDIEIWGRAWGCEEIDRVDISVDGGENWESPSNVHLAPRKEFEWQLFRSKVSIQRPGKYKLAARAVDKVGIAQPLVGRRNHVHGVEVEVA